MNEMWNLLTVAKNTCMKLKTQQTVTNSELESLFKVYWYKDAPNVKNYANNSAFNSIISAVTYIVEKVLLDYYISSLKNWKRQFVEILVDDIEKWSNNLELILKDSNEQLPQDMKLNDDESKDILNKFLTEKIIEELSNSDYSWYESLQTTDLQKIIDKIKSINYLESDVKNKIESWFSWILFGKIAPDLEQILIDFTNEIKTWIQNVDAWFDAKSHKDKFFNSVRNLENNTIVRWSSGEDLLKECKKRFESEFDKLLWELVTVLIKQKMIQELEDFDNEYEIDNYTKSLQNTYWKVSKLLNEIIENEPRKNLQDILNKAISDARITCKSKPPKVKTFVDDDWVEYAIFKTEKFPVTNYEEKMKEMWLKKKSSMWKIEPKILPNWNVLITFRDHVSGKTIIPNDSKRLRWENPYELSREERKEIEKQIKNVTESKELPNKILELQRKIKSEKDETVRENLKQELQEYIKKIPLYERVRSKLKMFDKYIFENDFWNPEYIKSKIPDFDPDTIKITPDIMENLREIAECAATQLKSKSWGLIIEWEAWVWKNVLIDIFAHFTNRPVFVFACGKKTDGHDLTYQWILDEKGSKKLNSKIYEAIHTPWAILVLDEINTLDAWVIKMLNGLFDKRRSLVSPEAGGKDAKALDDVLIFGTMNPVSYSWTQKIPQDVSSRFHFISQDYDWMLKSDWSISYSDALIAYWNVNYFWKLAAWNWMKKEDIELYEEALLDKKIWNKLSKKKQEILEKFKPISDTDFIWAWNQLFNLNNEREVIDRFDRRFVEWMKDIYDIVLYSNYIRMRHKISQSWVDTEKFPWDTETDEYFSEKSFSPRLVIQSLEQLHNWNEISDAKEAVIQTYIQQVSDVNHRAEIKKHFLNTSKQQIEKYLKSSEVQNFLFNK